ncbi:hypothetical protein MishRS11D_00110 [Methylomagnum ishizawai]|nr:hypothetical protein MishRS11D_00110 [Methylomagnum ishizawai]
MFEQAADQVGPEMAGGPGDEVDTGGHGFAPGFRRKQAGLAFIAGLKQADEGLQGIATASSRYFRATPDGTRWNPG